MAKDKSTDVWNVTAAYDKPQYNKGDTITVTISGGDVSTDTKPQQSGTLTMTITSADGATTTITVPPTTIMVTTTTPQSVKITAVADTSNRPWTINANGLSASAIA